MRRQPIFGLDAIRFFAAVAVVLYHVAYKPFALETSTLHSRIGGAVFAPSWSIISWWGWIGVQIFFVISGLVISYSAVGATPYTFFRSRIARLVPAMLICATFIGFVVSGWESTDLGTILILWIKSVVFFPIGPWLSGQFWTLGVEISFYAVVWMMILFKSINRLENLAWILCFLSAIYWGCVGAGLIYEGFLPRVTQLLLLQDGCYFAVGIILSIADRKGMTRSRWPNILICAATGWFQISTTMRYETPLYSGTVVSVVPYTIWVAVIAVVGMSLYWKTQLSNFIGSAGKYWRATGLATYPLYLIHMHVGGPVLVWLTNIGAASPVAWFVALLTSIVIAYIIALCLEPPLQRLTFAIFSRMSIALARGKSRSTAA